MQIYQKLVSTDDEPQSVHAFITKDTKYIIVFRIDIGYNVYDIDSNCWLLEKILKCGLPLDVRRFDRLSPDDYDQITLPYICEVLPLSANIKNMSKFKFTKIF